MKFLVNFFCAFLLFESIILICNDKPWTWIHKKEFTQEQRTLHQKKGEIVCNTKEVPPFTQLVFSWNAFRPAKGHFTFYVQVRQAHTKSWSTWHKMIEWGCGIQRSYASKSDGIAQYHYVRLEMIAGSKADAFAIKIEAHDDADISLVQSCAVNCSDFDAFTAESTIHTARLLLSVLVPGVPMLSQFEVDHPRNDGLCSPTSCTMLASYLLKKPLDPRVFAQSSLDYGLDQYGSWPFNTAHAFTACEGKVSFLVGRLNSFAGIYTRLKRGIPVVVSVRGELPGAPKKYSNGHLLVVVGYDSQKNEVICHDPATHTADQTQQRYQLQDFVRAWERSKRLSYLAEPRKIG